MQTLPSTEPGSVQATGLRNVFFVLGMPPGQGVGGGPPVQGWCLATDAKQRTGCGSGVEGTLIGCHQPDPYSYPKAFPLGLAQTCSKRPFINNASLKTRALSPPLQPWGLREGLGSLPAPGCPQTWGWGVGRRCCYPLLPARSPAQSFHRPQPPRLPTLLSLNPFLRGKEGRRSLFSREAWEASGWAGGTERKAGSLKPYPLSPHPTAPPSLSLPLGKGECGRRLTLTPEFWLWAQNSSGRQRFPRPSPPPSPPPPSSFRAP